MVDPVGSRSQIGIKADNGGHMDAARAYRGQPKKEPNSKLPPPSPCSSQDLFLGLRRCIGKAANAGRPWASCSCCLLAFWVLVLVSRFGGLLFFGAVSCGFGVVWFWLSYTSIVLRRALCAFPSRLTALSGGKAV